MYSRKAGRTVIKVSMIKPMQFMSIIIALVIQALFFAVNSSGDVKPKNSPITYSDVSIRHGFSKEGENTPLLSPPSQGGSVGEKNSQ